MWPFKKTQKPVHTDNTTSTRKGKFSDQQLEQLLKQLEDVCVNPAIVEEKLNKQTNRIHAIRANPLNRIPLDILHLVSPKDIVDILRFDGFTVKEKTFGIGTSEELFDSAHKYYVKNRCTFFLSAIFYKGEMGVDLITDAIFEHLNYLCEMEEPDARKWYRRCFGVL